jgi:hypothetical protein
MTSRILISVAYGVGGIYAITSKWLSSAKLGAK